MFHILVGNRFRNVSFQPMSMTPPPPEYTPRPLKKVLTIYVSENRIYE